MSTNDAVTEIRADRVRQRAPMVIWSFRNASATGGMRSASLMRPYYVAPPLMWWPHRTCCTVGRASRKLTT